LFAHKCSLLALAVLVVTPGGSQAQNQSLAADILVYGATSAGIAASLNAASLGHSVVLAEESPRIGGMLTSGLSYSDFRTQASVQGAFRDYMERAAAHYRRTYGEDSPQARECFEGAHAEPRVSLQVLKEMLAAEPRVRLLTRRRLVRADSRGGEILLASFEAPDGGRVSVRARVFIDATYEGDLAAAAGAAMRTGREGVREYGERLAGRIYFRAGALLYGGSGEGDRAIQCYNFRVTMTSAAANRLAIAKPEGYDRTAFEALVPLFREGVLTRAFSEDRSGVLRLQRLPNSKSDMNDINTSPVGFGLPGRNWEYPEGPPAVRRRIFEEHKRHALGLLYFLQNDAALPEAVRAGAREWGLPKDEFEETGHFPPQIYVREGRRLVGRYTFTQNDIERAPGTARARLHPDSIAIGDYPLNSHGVSPAGSPYASVREGYFVYGDLPYQIPYGVMVPETVRNLLVPVAVSASHVGYSAVRMEPTWTALGQAAGIAAHLAVKTSSRVAAVPVSELRRILHSRGAATYFFADISRTHPRFALLQELGGIGYFHEPVGADFLFHTRKVIYGLQYFDAPSGHAAALDQALSPVSLAHAQATLRRAGWKVPAYRSLMTRGDYIEEIARLNGR
jgi:hypothetical protein